MGQNSETVLIFGSNGMLGVELCFEAKNRGLQVLGASKNNPDFNLETKFIIANSPCYIGVKSGNLDLLQWVNVFILHKKLNGKLNELSLKWLEQPLPELPTL